MTSAAITWSGRATWRRLRARSSPAARMTRCCASCAICVPCRRRTEAGRRTAGLMAHPTGTASSSMNALSRCCCLTWPGARARCRGRCCQPTGRWSREPRDSSSATAHAPARTAGRRMPATRRSPSPFRSPRCSPLPISPTPATSMTLPTSCATRPTRGTSRSRIGSTSPTPG